jgi:hypothetical protein
VIFKVLRDDGAEVLVASIISAMMMEAAGISETSVNFCQPTCGYNKKTAIFILTVVRT